jgi:hypothetical protein
MIVCDICILNYKFFGFRFYFFTSEYFVVDTKGSLCFSTESLNNKKRRFLYYLSPYEAVWSWQVKFIDNEMEVLMVLLTKKYSESVIFVFHFIYR